MTISSPRNGKAGRLLAALLAAGAWASLDRSPAMATTIEPKTPQPPMPEPRDPDIAVREEYQAAVAAGTIAALDLFIRRHPDHDLADLARRELERLESEQVPP
jgi:hypothetical protein